ncbi:hypothetical protein LUZ63_009162 [Rhynchospora breviuscula]|uniref:AP-5 complex subunit beta-1 n=1 Tax=Rhynchospora breviuscula TaxID=2022672 RepID=A0A9Q0CFB3_9POAL|nr:hypothetical protein LUZ63_009162 [Rhynchospora breviuscula]
MEKQTSFKTSPPLPNLSIQDWDSLLDDFSSGDASRRRKHLSLPLLDLCLHSLSRRDLPSSLKLSLLHFLDQHLPSIPIPSPPFPSLLSSLRSLLPSPDPSPLKEQLLITTTSLFISLLQSPSSPYLQSLIELLLPLINRPNHGPDRQTRGLVCESLRELESAFPCLLSEILGHVWALAQAERTHVAQSYLLLLTQISRNAVVNGLLSSSSSILSTSTPLTPFTIPQIALSDQSLVLSPPSDVNLREIRRVLAFLLDRPRDLTPGAISVLTSTLVDIADALEDCVPAVSALLKVNFSSLLSSHNPFLSHSILSLYRHFSEAFNDHDIGKVAYRLQLSASDTSQKLIFRLLALHWLYGSTLLTSQVSSLTSLPGFYPQVFDPLAVKAKKLDAISVIASEGDEAVSLLEDGLVCISYFRWLPGWSTETLVAFRAMHKLLIGVMPHDGSDNGPGCMRLGSLMESTIFADLENVLIHLALEHHPLVPVIATFSSRLLQCETHSPVSSRFLQTLDRCLIPNLKPGYGLSFYFPLLEKISENETVAPKGVLELLKRHMVCLTDEHGPDTGHRSWSQGSRVLSICRVMLKKHKGSQIFRPLSRLLAFTCQNFPDLEVRDNARIYLRMLACIPGKKLRQTLSIGEQKSGLAPAPLPASLIDVPPHPSPDLKKSTGIGSYIHLERLKPPLVKQSWFLPVQGSVPALSNGSGCVEGGIMDIVTSVAPSSPDESNKTDSSKVAHQKEASRVMDPNTALLLRVLRTHFGCIPDYRVMPGIKIRIPCMLRFESDPFIRNWGFESCDEQTLPALYAIKITFSTLSKYGKIPSCRVPFLLGDSLKSDLVIVSVGQGNDENIEHSNFAKVFLELQPEDPMPGLIDIFINANTATEQVISGFLRPVTIGIEDMFLKAILPPNVSDMWVPRYYSDLFDTLWEACGSSVNIGRETFPLNGGKGAVLINGTQSVKFLEVPEDVLINAVERHLAGFVVRVAGAPLVKVIRQNRVIENIVWDEKEEEEDDLDVGPSGDDFSAENALVAYSREESELDVEYTQAEMESNSNDRSLAIVDKKKSVGNICVLIFLPPRYHLLFLMEIGYGSTMVRMRTDHWPCLAYVDEYLEALF